MITFDSILALLFLLLALGLLFSFSLPRRAQTARYLFRAIVPLQRLRRAIGLAVEDGTRVHVSLGKASVISPQNASALVGLSSLERIAQQSSISDRPPVVTSGDGSVAILSQDTLHAAYRVGNALDQYDPDRGRLAGPTALSYVAGTLPVLHQEHVSANLLVGNFGPEVVLLTEAADQEGAFALAASDSLPTQAALYASAQETLIGEELFAIPAYLQAGPQFPASLRVQDTLRWVLIAGLIVGAALKLVGIL